MTGVTIGTATIQVVKKISEGLFLIGSQPKSVFIGGQAGLKRFVVNGARTWSIDCAEQNVNYSSGSALYLRNLASAGTAVTMIADYGNLYYASANVAIDSVDLQVPLVGQQNIRYFTVTMHESL